MKRIFWCLLFSFVSLSQAYEVNEKISPFTEGIDCHEFSQKICQLKLGNVYGLHEKVMQEAFTEILKKQEVKSLICQYFDNRKGELVSDFKWNRNCWFYFYKKAIKRHGIKTCKDFQEIGGDSRFILNCQSYQDKAMALHVNDFRKEQLRKVFKKVLKNYREIFSGTFHSYIIESEFSKILQEFPYYYNLSNREIHFVKAHTLCDSARPEENVEICDLFQNSEQDVLTVGGLVFLEERYLEIEIARTVASHLSRFLSLDFPNTLKNIYKYFLTEKVLNLKLETIITDVSKSDPLNQNTMTYYLLRLYRLEVQKEGKDSSFPQIAYLCQQEISSVVRTEPYDNIYLTGLNILDRMQLIICPTLGDWEEDSSQSPLVNQ